MNFTHFLDIIYVCTAICMAAITILFCFFTWSVIKENFLEDKK